MKLKSVIVSLALVIASVFAPVSAQAYELTGVEVNSKHVVFASLDTGEIMYEKASEEKAFPVECQFCDTVYTFTPEDIRKLIKNA